MTIAASKRGANLDRLDFYEIASRNPVALICGLMKKPAFKDLEAAVLDASYKLPRAGTRPPRVEYAGAVVSEPGATFKNPCRRTAVLADWRRFFVPLVDVPQDGDGTASGRGPARLLCWGRGGVNAASANYLRLGPGRRAWPRVAPRV